MPYIPHTPELLATRFDSKDHTATCRGITLSGQPCRRSLGASPRSPLPVPSPVRVSRSEIPGQGKTTFYCWQHKDQERLCQDIDRDSRQQRDDIRLDRTSIDTLVDRIAPLDAGLATPKSTESLDCANTSKIAGFNNRSTTSPYGQSRRSKGEQSKLPLPPSTSVTGRHRKKDSSWSLLSLLCCAGVQSEKDEPETFRIRPSKQPAPYGSVGLNLSSSQGVSQILSKRPPTGHREKTGNNKSHGNRKHREHDASEAVAMNTQTNRTLPIAARQHRASRTSTIHTPPVTELPNLTTPLSQTETFLSMIPKSLSPQITSLLLTELAKPLSDSDTEGYIYVYCLNNPRDGATSNVLGSSKSKHDNASKFILLKIGYASNVHRRMNQWTRQCGYELSLLRFYPYVPTSTNPDAPAASSPTVAKKVRHARRVERLVHLELADKKVKSLCKACGQVHREWFTVDANRTALRDVDRVVRRWVSWAGDADEE